MPLAKSSDFLVAGHVAVVQVVYHLGDAAHVEAHAGRAARHRFHERVGQVLFQRRGDEEVDRIVDVHQPVVVAHEVQRIDREGQQVGQLLRTLCRKLTTAELRLSVRGAFPPVVLHDSTR